MNNTTFDNTPLKNSLNTSLSRRGFLGASSAAVAGLSLSLSLYPKQVDATVVTQAVNAWLTIGIDNSVILTIGTSDMGQGSGQALAQALCEDLMVAPSRVQIITGKPSLISPVPVGASINTVGSGMIRNNFWKMRDAGAAAREMLVSAAMAQMGDASRSNYSVQDGVITHAATGLRLTYGQVAALAATLPMPVGAALVPNNQLRYIGLPVKRQDIPSKVDGSAIYGLDVRVPNMVYAVIKHCPSFGGVLAGIASSPSGAIAVVPTKVWSGTARGLEVVGNVNAVAVVAGTTWDAWQMAKGLNVSWTLPANAATLNSAQFLSDAKALLTSGTPYVAGTTAAGTVYGVENVGSAALAIGAASKVVEATYTVPYVSHACMEVLNCTVNYVAGLKCEVWAPTQSAKSALTLVMAMTGLSAAQVTINVTFLGGGLGRKAEMDFVSQAVQVAMAIGKPVKLMWPREEDFTHDVYRPMGAVRVRAGIGAGGYVAGWAYRTVSPSILAQRGVVLPATGDSQGYEAAQALPYNFGSRVTEYVSHPSRIPVGFWRSVGASINTFAVESMIDEVAAAAGVDAYQYRRSQLTDPRWIAVLEAAANAAGWGNASPTGTARGIAIGAAFNSIVAQVVEVAKGTGGPRVTRVWIAIDCGSVVNPNQVEAQLVGGVVHGMNATLYGKQTFVNGAAQSKNFNTNPMIRLGQMPQVTVKMIPSALDRARVMGGVGELGVPTFAPALANAWAKLSGARVRDLPFYPNATMGG